MRENWLSLPFCLSILFVSSTRSKHCHTTKRKTQHIHRTVRNTSLTRSCAAGCFNGSTLPRVSSCL
jgi:hypothetical protein